MDVALYIGGSDQGLDAPAGSEGRVIMNYAKNLVKNGHRAFCFGGSGYGMHAKPNWGSYKQYENVYLISFNELFSRTFDVIINVPKEIRIGPGANEILKCNAFNNLAPLLFHVYFSWGPNSDDYMKDCNHSVFQPVPVDPAGEQCCIASDRNIYLVPFPYRETSSININPASRDTLCWVAKGVFDDGWPQDMPMHTSAVTALSAIQRVSNRLNIRCVFTMSETLYGKRAQRLGVSNIVDNINNKILYPGLIPKCNIDAEFNRSRVNVVLMNYLASCLDSAGLGCVPLFMPDGEKQNQYYHCMPSTPIVNESSLETTIEKLFTDDKYYKTTAEKVFYDIGFYSYEESYKRMMMAFDTERARQSSL